MLLFHKNERIDLRKKTARLLFDSFVSGLFIVITFSLMIMVIFLIKYDGDIVIGESMMPTITEGSSVYIENKSDIEVGDLVVSHRPEGEYLVLKRVLATGGEKIGIFYSYDDSCYHVIKINKNATTAYVLEESYIADSNANSYDYSKLYDMRSLYPSLFTEYNYEGDEVYLYNVPENSYFIMGDNRAESTDSTNYGAVSADMIVGKAFIIIQRYQSSYWQIFVQYVLGFRRIL